MTQPAPPPPASPPKRTAPPPPPPKAPPPVASATTATTGPIAISKGRKVGKAEKIGVYGPGGIGKSSMFELAQLAGFNPLVLDIEGRTGHLDVSRVDQDRVSTFDDVMAVLNDDALWKPYNMVGIDTMTVVEQLATAWTLTNVPKPGKGENTYVKNLKAYGWGDGDTFVYETFLKLFAALDRHASQGRWILCVAHDYTARVDNPAGENFIRYEPRLMSSRQGNIAAKFKEWIDHLFFIGYDMDVTSDGKARGSGSRAFYTQELPTHLAKTSYAQAIPVSMEYVHNDPTIFNLIKQANQGA